MICWMTMLAISQTQKIPSSEPLAARDLAEFQYPHTAVIRASVYRDECQLDWQELVQAPLRAMVRHVPA